MSANRGNEPGQQHRSPQHPHAQPPGCDDCFDDPVGRIGLLALLILAPTVFWLAVLKAVAAHIGILLTTADLRIMAEILVILPICLWWCLFKAASGTGR